MATLRYQFPYIEKGAKRPDPPALRGGTVQIAMPAASRSDRRLMAIGTTPSFQGGVSWSAIVDAPIVNARVFVSPDVNPNYTYGVAFSTIADGITQYTTPLLRVINDQLVSLGGSASIPMRSPTQGFSRTGIANRAWASSNHLRNCVKSKPNASMGEGQG